MRRRRRSGPTRGELARPVEHLRAALGAFVLGLLVVAAESEACFLEGGGGWFEACLVGDVGEGLPAGGLAAHSAGDLVVRAFGVEREREGVALDEKRL